MSVDTTVNQTSSPEGASESASTRVGFALVAAVGSAILLTWLATLCRIMPERTVLLLAGVSVFGVAWSITPPIVLALLVAILSDSPGHWLGVLPSFGRQLSFAELSLAATFVIYAPLVYRFQRAREDLRCRPRVARSPSGDSLQDVGEWLLMATLGFVLATVARWILPFLFVGRAMSGTFHLVPAVAGFLMAMVILGLASWLWNVAVRAVGRAGMTESEARLILHQTIDAELGSDLRMIDERLGRAGRQDSLLRPMKM
jgi:uncharacterized membrane protein YeaQ/YmgE (transglycosylase-associated protein family)